MGHDHNHSHHHHHHKPNYNRAFAIGVLLNIAFVAVEITYGLLADSLALLADAWHNLSDVFALLLAWGASYLATHKPSDTRTYGLKRGTILASLVSTALLLLALGAIAWEAVQRLFEPAPVESHTVIVVASIGMVINTITALLFLSGSKHDLNIRAAFLHMAADAAISLGVALGGGLILLTAWLWLDPAITLVIVAVIFASSWTLLRDSLNLAMDAVPSNIDLDAVRGFLLDQDWVLDLHDLHVWALSTTETALTVHVITATPPLDNGPVLTLQEELQHRFGIEHSTIQVELSDPPALCLLNRPHCS